MERSVLRGGASCFLAALALALAACGGSDGPRMTGDVLTDAVADDGADAADARPPVDTRTDLPADDVPQDPGADTPEDLAADVPADVPGPGPFDPALAAYLQQILDEYVHFSGDPGIAFAIHDGDRRTWSGVAGMADVLAEKPVTADSRFRVGSNTKPITATWILQLVEEGKIDLDAAVTDYFPEYPQWSAITVRHLLGMQSGIPEYIADTTVLLTVLGDPEHVWTPAEVLAVVKDKPLLFAPGTGGAYTNASWILLGMIGEKVTGRTARDEIHDRLLAPLGLKDTYLEVAGDPTDRLVHGYMDMSVLVPLMKLPSAMFAVIPEDMYLPGTQTIDATSLLHPSLTWTAGSIVSTPDDLATFQRALQRGQLLGTDMMNEMRDWHTITLLGGTVDYGLGLMRQQTAIGDLIGHGGLNFGFHVETYYSPDLDAAFCHMHNFLPAQTAAVTTEALTAFLTGGADPLAGCEVPDSFFGDSPVEEPVLKIRFKGPVGEASKPAEQQPGMSSTWASLGGPSWVRLFGFDRVGIYAGAALSTSIAGTYVTMTSWGKGDGGDNYLREMFWNLKPDLLARANADGVVTLAAADAWAAGAMLMDYELDDNLKVVKGCIVAVSDVAQNARVFACDGAATMVAPGKMLRVAGRLPLTTDVATIEGVASALGMTRCTCYDAAQQPVTCP
jgi:D-alanyl-D-alanine carboxypeptidase